MTIYYDLTKFKADILNQLVSLHPEIESLQSFISSQILELETSAISSLESKTPFTQDENLYMKSKISLKYAQEADLDHINSDLAGYQHLSPELDISFWLEKRSQQQNLQNHPTSNGKDLQKKSQKSQVQSQKSQVQSQKEIDLLIRENIQSNWRKELDKKKLDWEIKILDEMRKTFINQIDHKLKNIKKIQSALDTLNLFPGLFWDLSLGHLVEEDIAAITELAQFLEKNEAVRELCEILGRLNHEAKEYERVKILEKQSYVIPKASSFYRDEIVGIKQSKQISEILPQELSLLSEPTLSALFDLKYVENRLLAFDKHGIEYTEIEVEEEKIIDQEKKKNKGPMILCVDTSGSMIGAPEKIAKAITFFIATKAYQEKRDCYLINFSTQIEIMDFSKQKSLSDLISFLKKSFHGGTDVLPALKEGIQKMNTAQYQNADMLIISDFVMEINNHQLIESIKNQQIQNNRFFALSIGRFNLNHISKIFDQEWLYDHDLGQVIQLAKMISHLLDY
jgi:uncharacterized protein with von Willebrand factor type A (vWA) domain